MANKYQKILDSYPLDDWLATLQVNHSPTDVKWIRTKRHKCKYCAYSFIDWSYLIEIYDDGVNTVGSRFKFHLFDKYDFAKKADIAPKYIQEHIVRTINELIDDGVLTGEKYVQ